MILRGCICCFRKPVVGLPIWSDGADAVNNLVRRGCALKVAKGASELEIYDTLSKVRSYVRSNN